MLPQRRSVIFLDKKRAGSSAKTYCVILTVATILSVPLMALWEVNIFSLDFFATSMAHMLGLAIAYVPGTNTPIENETIILTFWVISVIILLFIFMSLFLWKRFFLFSKVFFASIIALDLVFLTYRIVICIPGAKSNFYFIGSFLWKIYGIVCIISSLRTFNSPTRETE